MRRTARWVVAACALTAACTTDPGVSVTTDPFDDTTGDPTGDTTGDPTGDTTGSAAAPSDRPGGGVGDAALPGLLDASDEPIPNDDAVRSGVLDNGLTYYVRENDNPGAKAELRLVVRAGSVDELGDATGVAHFVEHMLFNGTEAFPENELIDVLRGFGAAFGADVNAFTSYDETVYSLTVPNDATSLATATSILVQWLTSATFDPAQVEAERGVVVDEWRVRTQTTSGRLFEVADGLFLDGTAYEGRSPIGTRDAIETVTREELVGYYDAWYRPDNVAIVVVGDIDVDDVVEGVEQLFGPVGTRAPAPARVDSTFEVDTEPAFALHSDPDQTTVDVEVTLPLPATSGSGTAAVRTALLDEMIVDALVRRLDQDVTAGTAPFDRIVPGTNSYVDGLDAPALAALTDPDRVDATLQALLDEYERADRFGFDDREVELAAAGVLARYESRYAGRDSTQDAEYADQYVEHFLRSTPYPAVVDEYELVTSMVEAITAEALDLRFRARWRHSAPHVIVSAPDTVADRMPDERDVLAAIEAAAERGLEPRPDLAELPDGLMERPAPVEPAEIEQLLPFDDPLFDPIELTFPNGARVIVNSNPIVEGQVYLRAGSPGGSSLVADDDVVDALCAADVVTASGVADLDAAEVGRVLAGDDVQFAASITPYLELFEGAVATDDLESLFQLVHLTMTRPRFDQAALDRLVRAERPIVEDPGSDPELAAFDALLDARHPGELRYAVLPPPDAFDTLDLAGVERVWNARFGDATDWVFVFSGDVSVDRVSELAGAYIGTLPASGVGETWIDVGRAPPPGIVRSTVTAGTGDTATVSLLFSSPIAPDELDGALRATADVAGELVGARLTDVIREELGASYSPFAISSITADPEPVIETYVSVSASPDDVDRVADLVVSELADVAGGGATDRELANARAQVAETYGFVDNAQFLTELLDDRLLPGSDLDDYIARYGAISALTADDVAAFLARHVPVDRHIVVTVVPR